MKNKSAIALGRKSVEKRHAKILANGGDISSYYSDLRKKGLKNGKNKPKIIA